MILSNDGFVAFHYRSYGTFFLHKIGSIISIGDLPTTNIIEPLLLSLVTQTDAFEDLIHTFGIVSWVKDFVNFFLSEA